MALSYSEQSETWGRGGGRRSTAIGKPLYPLVALETPEEAEEARKPVGLTGKNVAEQWGGGGNEKEQGEEGLS